MVSVARVLLFVLKQYYIGNCNVFHNIEIHLITARYFYYVYFDLEIL